jgi:hypothetical protein
MSKSSPFRFVSSRASGQYSVWRGEEHIGWVAKIVHRISDRGVTKTIVAGWIPKEHTASADLPIEKTRDAAANALWREHLRSRP